jgi:rod shape-determining protein MreD
VGDAFIPELSAVLIVYLVICAKPSTAAVFALSQGLLLDIYSAGLRGLFVGFYLVVFWVAMSARSLFDINHAKGQFLITSLSVALGKVLFFIAVNFVSPNAFFHWSWVWRATSAALLTGMIAPLVIFFLQVVRGSYMPEWTEGFETELDEVGVLPKLWRPAEEPGDGSEPEDSIKSEKL